MVFKLNYVLKFIFLVFPYTMFGQYRHTVIDSLTREPISYVNILVANEGVGTTTNEKGEFSFSKPINGKVVVFSAIGYKTKRINFYDTISVVTLHSIAIELKEVVILSNKKSKKQEIDSFRKSDMRSSFANNEYPWLLAKYFPFSDSLHDTPYLESINIFTESKISNAKFILKILSCDSAGMPGAVLYHDNILATAKKGNHTTQVSVGDLMITMPESGLFVVFESLMIEDNKSEFKYTKKDTKEVFTKIRYNPSIGGILVDSMSNSWFYTGQLQWQKFSTVYSAPRTAFDNRLSKLAISITLTD